MVAGANGKRRSSEGRGRLFGLIEPERTERPADNGIALALVGPGAAFKEKEQAWKCVYVRVFVGVCVCVRETCGRN